MIGVYDAGQEGDLNYIVMEFVDGVTLQEYVTGDRNLSPNQVVDVIYQCAKGLDYVHREGIIHRDLKPGNIMLSNDGQVKIMDFSIAHVDVGFRGSRYRSAGLADVHAAGTIVRGKTPGRAIRYLLARCGDVRIAGQAHARTRPAVWNP